MSFSAFEHRLLKVLKSEFPGSGKVWVSCSFGLDSLVLLEAMNNLKPILSLDINVIHVHHGESDDPVIKEYRDKSLKAAQDYCESHKINLRSFKSEKGLESEKDCRDFRFSCYESLEGGEVFLAHHRQDFVETMMLKLLRGVGKQGFNFGNKKFKKFNVYRPLLGFLKKEIEEEASLKSLKPIEDPSNKSDKYLRNWLRNTWLEDLENHRPGSLKSLGESLHHLQGEFLKSSVSEQKSNEAFKVFVTSCEIPLVEWLVLSLDKKMELTAQILYSKSVDSFTTGQIEEVVKQLDLIKNEHIFVSAGVMWSKDKKSIKFRNC